MAADRPIVTALRLPERINDLAGAGYVIDRPRMNTAKDGDRARDDRRLRGFCCQEGGVELGSEASAAIAGGADFILSPCNLKGAEIAKLCAAVNVPVYASGISLRAAWRYGASGVHALTCQ